MDFSQKNMGASCEGINSDVPDLDPIKHPRTGWEELFRKAEEEEHIPDNDLFENLLNNFDAKGWT